jgi:hypothetical protein
MSARYSRLDFGYHSADSNVRFGAGMENGPGLKWQRRSSLASTLPRRAFSMVKRFLRG